MPTARQIRLFSEATQVLLGQVLAMAGALVLIRVLSQHLDPGAFGTLALALTGSLLVTQAISSGSTAAIVRSWSPAREAGAEQAYLLASLQMLGRDQQRIAGLAAAVALLLALLQHGSWALLALGAGLVAMAGGWSLALTAMLTGARHRLAASALTAVEPWLKIGLLELSWQLWPAGVVQTLLLYGLSTTLIALGAAAAVRRLLGWPRAGLGDVHAWILQMRDYGRPYSRFGLVTWLQQASDRWALQLWAGPAAVGHYAVVFQLGYSPLGTLSNMLNSLVAPILYGRAGDATDAARNRSVHRLLRKLALVGLVLSAVAFGLAWLVHRWLFALLVAPAYRDAALWFPWMVLAGSLFSVGQLIGLRFTSENRTSLLGRIKTLTALLGVLLNALGAALHGMAGVVVAQNLFSLVYLVCMIRLGLGAQQLPRASDA